MGDNIPSTVCAPVLLCLLCADETYLPITGSNVKAPFLSIYFLMFTDDLTIIYTPYLGIQ